MTTTKLLNYYKHLLTYSLSLLLLSCAAIQPDRSSVPEVEMAAASPPMPVWDILNSKEIPLNIYGAYGYLVFTKRPGSQEVQRYISVCEAFVRNLEPVSEYNYLPSNKLMPTYWLLYTSYDLYPLCDDWVAAYDYARAKSIASAISSLNSKGPILVAWNKPFESISNGENALILDLSDFSVEDLNRALGIWMDRITRNPKVWNEGFNIVKVKEAFRSFLEKYGDKIIASIKTVKEVIS